MRRVILAVMVLALSATRAQEAFGQCSISTMEINGALTLCADGGDAWEWTLPDGQGSSSFCIDAIADGTYMLRVFDAASGAWGVPCSYVKGTPPEPPPPAPTAAPACPAPTRWWSANCDPRLAVLDAETMSHVAERVDEHSALWSFAGQASGLCELLEARRHGRPLDATRRQFAAVHANLAAAELGVTDAGGEGVGLVPDMLLDGVQGVAPGTTLGAWSAAAESRLLAMGPNAGRDRVSREELRRIRRQARQINSGALRQGCASRFASLADDAREDVDEWFAPPGDAVLTMLENPMPFSGGARLRWSLQAAAEVQLDVVDVSGRRVRQLVAGTHAAGTFDVAWDGRDDEGRQLRPGAYFVAGRIAGERVTQRLVLLR